MKKIKAILALAVLSFGTSYAAKSARYPDNFRRWKHVETGVIIPGTSERFKTEEGMHHVFANPKAVDGYASGKFADGSIIVYELRGFKQENSVIVEGDRKRVDVMIKDSSRYGSTGGWRFERFWGDDQTQEAVQDSGASCFQCHSKANAHGFVFSQLR